METLKYIILVIIIVIFGVLTVFYFYYQPDSFTEYLSDQAVFYLRFDLNRVRQSGFLGGEFLRRPEIEKIIVGLFPKDSYQEGLAKEILKSKNLSILNEVGMQGFLSKEGEPKLDAVFYLKFNKFIFGADKKKFRKILNQYNVYEPQKGLLIISGKDKADLVRKGVTDKISRYPIFVENSSIGKGWVNYGQIIQGVSDNQNAQNISLTQEFAEFGITSYQPEERTIFYEINSTAFLSNDRAVGRNKNLLEDKRGGYVLIFSQTKEKNIEDQIRVELATKNPVEKSVLLPDGTTYVDLVIDPASFKFEDGFLKGTSYRYYSDNNNDKGSTDFFLWENGQNSFASNKIELMEKFLSQNEECLSYFKNKSFIKGFYWQLDKVARDFEMIDSGQKIYGCLGL